MAVQGRHRDPRVGNSGVPQVWGVNNFKARGWVAGSSRGHFPGYTDPAPFPADGNGLRRWFVERGQQVAVAPT
eukprot:scaffold48906_cov62-Phaeocystis_antarctica.AAC.4